MIEAPPTIIVSAAEAAAGLRHGWPSKARPVAPDWRVRSD